MNAISELGFRVENKWGRYRLSMEAALPRQERMSQLQVNRQRWTALQQRWQEVRP
jgi:hypothetical protein